jgi:MAF protein
MKPLLILASTSPFRKQILEKLNCSFQTFNPKIDETAKKNETAEMLVSRLALEKAQAASRAHNNSISIGSDQVCVINNKIIGKPGNFETAFAQLSAVSAQKITFYTGLSVVNNQTGQSQTIVEPFDVYFRRLTNKQISYYLETEQPYNCAGSFKCEGLGIALFEKLEGKDPNTLIGLPLISLVEILQNQGYDVLK